MIKLVRKNDGFTLIEIMMVIAILGIFFSILYNFIGFNFNFLNDRNSEQDSYLQGRVAMSRITYLLRQYDEIKIVDGNTVEGIKIKNKANNAEEWDKLINLNEKSNNYRYSFDKPSGQIFNESGDVVVKGVKELTISEENTGVLDIKVWVVPENEPNDIGLTLSTSIRKKL